jgi:CheY-like chemotaxis protein
MSRLPADATILVVDDDDSLRSVLVMILERGGYTVLNAATGAAALATASAHDGAIDLVVCDVVMPDMSGAETVRRLTAARTETRPLFISGYGPADITRYGVPTAGAAFMEKPIAAADLLSRVARLLGDAEVS